MRALKVVILIFLPSVSALALTGHIPFYTAPSKVILEKLDKLSDKRAKTEERDYFNDTFTEYFRRARPEETFKIQKYRKSLDLLETGEINQGWRDEAALALDGKPIPKVIYLRGDEDLYKHFYSSSQIATAKVLARAKMYEAIQNNWGRLKNTVFNEEGIECPNIKNCPAFDEVIMEKFQNNFFFNYKLTQEFDPDKYIFEFRGLGFINVNKKNMKTGEVIFGVSYLNDNNQMEKGYENLRTDVDAGLAPPPPPPRRPLQAKRPSRIRFKFLKTLFAMQGNSSYQ